MQRPRLSFGIQVYQCTGYLRKSIVRLESQYPIVRSFFFSIAPKAFITLRSLLKHEKVARVERDRALRISYAFFPAPLTPLDQSRPTKYSPIIGHGLASKFQFAQSAVIIMISLIKILRPCEMRFTGIRAEARRRRDRSEEHTSELQSQFHLVCRL